MTGSLGLAGHEWPPGPDAELHDTANRAETALPKTGVARLGSAWKQPNLPAEAITSCAGAEREIPRLRQIESVPGRVRPDWRMSSFHGGQHGFLTDH